MYCNIKSVKFTLNFVFMKAIIFILLFLPCIAIANMDSLTISLLGNRISTTDSIMENLFPQNIEEIELDSDKHLASKNARDDKYGFILQNPKQLRIPIPCNGQLNFFDLKPELTKIDEIKNDLFEDEHRYMWINHH